MEGELKAVIREKIIQGLEAGMPALTRREVYLPAIRGKALAVIGMRRSGKTTFLWQCMADQLAAGAPRETLLYFNFEDDRMDGLTAKDLHHLIEIYYQLHPGFRDKKTVRLYLDEIQLVPGWESFVRRIMDSEKVEIMLTGSSARLLSREIATSMRGRALEVLVHPFSFREYLSHRDASVTRPFSQLAKAAKSTLLRHFDGYLHQGGFPEAQNAPERDRDALLRSYVDVAMLRDVIERHSVSNPTALRWLVRQLLGNAAGTFSAQKFFDTLKSQGIAVAKDTVHAYLGHLEDAFLIRTVCMHSSSERQRMVNPRKAYPVDPGLIPVFERTRRANTGHALETAVLLELERRGASIGYLRTSSGYEIDFHADFPDGSIQIIQVCADLSSKETLEREVRALLDAQGAHPQATPLLLSMDASPPASLPSGIHWQSAAAWLLGDEMD
ncbi:MAG: ATP-binding protein [Verrucomicrobiaceae bacterium]|nr:ATP-binding protein [Verrucomicrobiaceae bacterium]